MTKDFKRYGWKVNEDNLKTLPNSAPQAARDLTKWLTLEGRRSSLEEWLGRYDSTTGKIHGKFWHIGSWTERMSHSAPNQANIPSIYKGTPVSAVEEVKDTYDGELRSCFKASPKSLLVGTDAEGIQLRVLCHYMKSKDYREAIVTGDSTLKTDIHNLNKKALGSICRTRDDAKTFIYAWLLGAGLPKIASILDCSIAEAKAAESSFLSSLPELRDLKTKQIPRDAYLGYFVGLDGRRVPCDSEYLMLAGYLQNGEAVVMKHANVLWRKLVDLEGINYKQVNFVHDEWQTEVYGTYDEAVRVGELQCEAITKIGEDFGLFCPLQGKSVVGINWKETH